MQVKHAEIDVLRRVRSGELPVSALDGLIDRARQEFPRPGELLVAISKNPKVAESARNAIQEILETCWNVIEFHGLLRTEEERGDAAHTQHARRMLDVWIDKLSDGLGPMPDEELVASSRAREESETATPPPVAEPAEPEPSEEDPREPVKVDAQDPDLGLLRGTLTDEEMVLATEIAKLTGHAPSVEFGERGVVKVYYPGPEGSTVGYLPPKGTERPVLYALARILNMVRRRSEVSE